MDLLTRQGQRLRVATELENLRRRQVPAEFLPALARIANRNSAYYLALRLLYKEIHDETESQTKLPQEAYAVYANSLLNIGALEEAKRCAQKASSSHEGKLVKAFIDFAQWNYENAIPHLQNYILSPETSAYQKSVGHLNLAAAFVSLGHFSKARILLEKLIQVLSSDPNSKLLLGNSYELMSQIEIFESHDQAAQTLLQKAKTTLAEFPGRYLLYVKKWEAVLELSRAENKKLRTGGLLDVKREARELRNWETLRDCDFHLARLTGDTELLYRVFYGTPYQAFRKRIEKVYGLKVPQTTAFSFCPTEISETPAEICWSLNDKAQWKDCSPLHWTLVQTMVKDIYRPPRMGVIFSSLYQGEKFNPFSSPQRVRNTVLRFNQWAQKGPGGFKIHIEKGDFFLAGPPGLGISINQIQRRQPIWKIQMQHFRQVYGGKSFSSQDLAQHLKISRRTATALLKKALSSKMVSQIGSGSQTRYLFYSSRRIP